MLSPPPAVGTGAPLQLAIVTGIYSSKPAPDRGAAAALPYLFTVGLLASPSARTRVSFPGAGPEGRPRRERMWSDAQALLGTKGSTVVPQGHQIVPSFSPQLRRHRGRSHLPPPRARRVLLGSGGAVKGGLAPTATIMASMANSEAPDMCCSHGRGGWGWPSLSEQIKRGLARPCRALCDRAGNLTSFLNSQCGNCATTQSDSDVDTPLVQPGQSSIAFRNLMGHSFWIAAGESGRRPGTGTMNCLPHF